MKSNSIIRIIFLLVFFVICALNIAAQNVNVTIQITNVTVNSGQIVGCVFYTAEAFRKEEPSIYFIIPASASTVSYAVSVPPGEYVITAFQDTNNNNSLDRNFLGVPREMVAVSNYTGRGFPTQDFNRQKIPVNSSTPIVSLGLYRF